MSPRVERLLSELTVDEKAAIVSGMDLWHTHPVLRLAIPSLKMTDGPVGARGREMLSGPTSACFPCGTALAATWNVSLVREVGVALGQECLSKGAHVLLAPTVNLHRSPLGGRHFECFSEDPHLTAEMAVAYIEGVQSTGAGACVKHFVCNDSEYERMTIDSQVDERTLREVYLAPFEAAVRRAGVASVMAAYNRLNGLHCSEHPRLLTQILRDEWGFDGFVVSDWTATHSTSPSANAGLDVEMPGPPRWYGEALAAAVRDGQVPDATLDAMARRVLSTLESAGALDDPTPRPEGADDRPEHREVARRAATESAVLLKNDDGLLPLHSERLGTLALIGPNAATARVLGGGSAHVRPHYTVSPLDGIADRLGGSVRLVHERGASIEVGVPVLDGGLARRSPRDGGGPGAVVEYFEAPEPGGTPAASAGIEAASVVFADSLPPSISTPAFSARIRAELHPDESGTHTLSLSCAGRARLLLDGAVVVDLWDHQPRGTAFFGRGSGPVEAPVDLIAGRSYELVAEFAANPSRRMRALEVGCRRPDGDLLERAVSAAAGADAAVVVVGMSADWETEGRDRTSLDLPGDQDALVEAVAARNPNTVVVVNAGAPIAMPWLDRVAAVLLIWYPGQECGRALAGLLFGDASPSGRLPTTFPRRLQDTPSWLNYPGEFGAVRYGEGVFTGHRGYEARGIEPLFWFGHGLSYTTFEYGPPRVSQDAIAEGEGVEVSVEVANTGEAAAAEVVQVYVSDLQAPVRRPAKELRGFAKVFLEPGERRVVTIGLVPRAFQLYDAARARWTGGSGEFDLLVGRSAGDIRGRVRVRTGASPQPEEKS